MVEVMISTHRQESSKERHCVGASFPHGVAHENKDGGACDKAKQRQARLRESHSLGFVSFFVAGHIPSIGN